MKARFISPDCQVQRGGIDPQPPYLEVRDYLPSQVLYAPSIRTVSDRIQLGPDDQNRLTIELDREGYVQEVICR